MEIYYIAQFQFYLSSIKSGFQGDNAEHGNIVSILP